MTAPMTTASPDTPPAPGSGPGSDVGSGPLAGPWRDPSLDAEARVDALLRAMTLPEKIAQLYGIWVGASDDGAEVAPHQHDMEEAVDLDALLPTGLGQLTRPFGTVPVDPALGALSLMRTQARIAAANRFGIPAVAHEECLAGFAAWGATAYPVPLSWGATFDPELIREMAGAIGRDLRAVGVHQGLAPVLDVVRDARWGRVEETIGEDPYLVGTIATAYVQGLESAGVVATLKHFAGYSASRAGRNLAPVGMGRRELADVILPPFEMAVRESGVRSVMHAYTDTDGVPAAADDGLLTGLLRDAWGFTGTVVADYFGIAFLKTLHGVAGSLDEAAGVALAAGVDVELPTVKAFGGPLVDAVEHGRVPESLVDRAARRVLLQKVRLGLLDPDWSPVPPALTGLVSDADTSEASDPARLRGTVDLDPASNRELARRVAERAVVLLRNDGTLPLDPAVPRRIALIGPTAEAPTAVLGCYSFPVHVGGQHPDVPLGIELPTLHEALRAEFPAAEFAVAAGTGIDDGSTEGIAEAVADGVRVAPLRREHAEQVLAIYSLGIDEGNATFETAAPTWEAFDSAKLPVHPGARGRSVGLALLTALLASTDAAGIWTVQSGIFPENTASLALHRRAGFRVIGTRERIGRHHGTWRDVVLVERRSPEAGC